MQMVLRGSKEERGTARTGKRIRWYLSQARSSDDINSMEEFSSVQLTTECGKTMVRGDKEMHLTDVFDNQHFSFRKQYLLLPYR